MPLNQKQRTRLKTSAQRQHAQFQKLRLTIGKPADGREPTPEENGLWLAFFEVECAFMKLGRIL